MFLPLLLLSSAAFAIRINPEVKESFLQICASLNYTVAEHFVTTLDGYILRVFRVGGKNVQGFNSGPPVYLQHGLIDSSDNFFVNSEALAPGFIVANQGYDVWLGNSRGNKYSRNHTTLNPNTNATFWNFSWQEMAEFDLPATVDFILEQTGEQKLAYIGHSQGTTIMMTKMSEDPLFASKISVAALLAPVASVSNQTSSLLTLASKANIPLVLKDLKINEVMTSPDNFMVSYLCLYAEIVCSEMLFLLADANTTVDNTARMDVIMSHYPAGTSSRDIDHWVQMAAMKYAVLQKYNFGSGEANIEAYGFPTPPIIDLTQVSGKVALFAGLYDRLADTKDVAWLMTQLPPSNVVWFKGDYPCGHGTWLWAKDMSYFDDVLAVIADSFSS
jgi:gastric triacylglycerol lipase